MSVAATAAADRAAPNNKLSAGDNQRDPYLYKHPRNSRSPQCCPRLSPCTSLLPQLALRSRSKMRVRL